MKEDKKQKKMLFVVNPQSGTHDKEQILHLINDRIDSTRYSVEIRLTQYAGHAVEIAAQAAKEQVFAVVAVGGDGTMNEVGRSLIGSKTAMGIIPCGSGNGLARHLQIPMDARRAVDLLNAGIVTPIDYGLINEHPFFCTCGVGFDASVSKKFGEAGRRGLLTYFEKTLRESLNYQSEMYELETEEGMIADRAFLIACGNASQYGNNAYITPLADLSDGLLDVTMILPFNILDVPALAFQLFNRTINQNRHIHSFRCRKLCIKRTQEGMAHFDGDPVKLGRIIHIELIHHGINVLIPPKKIIH
ncbi:MAG: YegS/Rv2252/BmrU family lipid kinase [Prevotellaceae bacterium]|jgi:YegS/Rv2252/BmrU family lipid kinase|nr:YegS/Rv2252/BmrU family lipid kinase [Prevotellaceae bacterium]